MWDVATSWVTAEPKGARWSQLSHTGCVNSCAWSPNGGRIACASTDHTVRVWDVDTMREVARLEGHHKSVLSCRWSPDGLWLATGSWAGAKTRSHFSST